MVREGRPNWVIVKPQDGPALLRVYVAPAADGSQSQKHPSSAVRRRREGGQHEPGPLWCSSESHAVDRSLPGRQYVLLGERQRAGNHPRAGGLCCTGAEARWGGEVS